jgi:hypothetical protein
MSEPLARFRKEQDIKTQYTILFKDEQVMRRAFGAIYDHVRAYKTADKRLIITMSPYRDALTEQELNSYQKLLYSEPLYHEMANTYCLEFESIAEFKRAIKDTKAQLATK